MLLRNQLINKTTSFSFFLLIIIISKFYIKWVYKIIPYQIV